MKDLFVSTQGVRGGNTTTNKKGFVSILLQTNDFNEEIFNENN